MKKYIVTNEVLKLNSITEKNAKDYFLSLIESGYFIEIDKNVEMSVSNILTDLEDELLEKNIYKEHNSKVLKKRTGIKKEKSKNREYIHNNQIVKDAHSYKKIKKAKNGVINKYEVKSLKKNYYIKNKRTA